MTLTKPDEPEPENKKRFNIMQEYKRLNETCDLILERIAKRKSTKP